MHIAYRLENTESFSRKKEEIMRFVRENQICIRKELDPLSQHLYKRYFG